jgi:hypothetical protein
MKFSYSAVWEDTLRLLRENARLLAAIAGVFIFLPALLLAQFLPPPEVPDPARVWEVLGEYYRRSWPWYLLQSLFSIVGTAAMLRLILTRGTSVGDALGFALIMLPSLFLLTVIMSVMIGVGAFLLIVPGLYLAGRLAPATALMVAENRRNPLAAVGRSFEITKGHGWAVFGLVFIIALIGWLIILVITMLTGTVFILAAGQDLGKLLGAIVSSGLAAAFATVLLTVYAAIYRALTGSTSVAAAFE